MASSTDGWSDVMTGRVRNRDISAVVFSEAAPEGGDIYDGSLEVSPTFPPSSFGPGTYGGGERRQGY